MRARPVKEWPSGKMSPETFGHGVYAFPKNCKVEEEMADNFKGRDKVPLAYVTEKQIKQPL